MIISPKTLTGAFYVTGPAGAGKTTLTADLQRLGYNARDIDNGLGHFKNNDGTIVPPSQIHPENEEWARHHQWAIDGAALRFELNRFRNNHIFICGAARNQYDFFPLFTKVFYLDAGQQTITERVQQERDHSYGKHAFQLRKIIEDMDDFRQRVQSEGAILINAEQAAGAVTTDILEAAAA